MVKTWDLSARELGNLPRLGEVNFQKGAVASAGLQNGGGTSPRPRPESSGWRLQRMRDDGGLAIAESGEASASGAGVPLC